MSGIGFTGGGGAAGVQVLAQSAVAVPLTGTLVETTLAQVVVPAGAMGKNGQVEVEALLSCTNNANSKLVKVKFGGATLFNFNFGNQAAGQARKRISNRNAANSQITSNVQSFPEIGFSPAVLASAEDTAQAVTIAITATLGNVADTVTLESWRVLLMAKA